MKRGIVIIIMGSRSDEAHARKIVEAASGLGIESELRVASAHKNPGDLLEILARYEADGRPKVYVTVAGRSNALSGFVDGAVRAPVLACPPPSDAYGGVDLWSSVRMPGGIAAALVMDPANAALFAAKILALADPSIEGGIRVAREARVAEIRSADSELRRKEAGGQAEVNADASAGAGESGRLGEGTR